MVDFVVRFSSGLDLKERRRGGGGRSGFGNRRYDRFWNSPPELPASDARRDRRDVVNGF